MARQQIDKSTVRNKLSAQAEPYWGAPLKRGLFLGFRKLALGGSWIARFRLDNGRQTYRSLGDEGGLDYDSAKKLAVAWASSLQAGIDSSSVRTLSEACRKYVEDRRQEVGEANANDANNRFKRTIYGDVIGSIKLEHLRSDHIKSWRSKLDMKPSSANRTLSSLKAALNFAVASRFVDAGRSIEWTTVKPAKVTSSRDLYLDRDQCRSLLGRLEPWAHDFIKVLTQLPIRPGALAMLQVKDFAEKTKQLTIHHDKAGAGRSIQLPGSIVGLFVKNAAGKLPIDPLFSYEDGTFWNKERWKQPIKRAAKSAGLPDETCAYTLRHSVITELVLHGLDLVSVAKIAGTSLLMIDKHYGKLRQQHAADAMDALIELS